jgi:hypothetical protein
MSTQLLLPACVSAPELQTCLQTQGYAVMDAHTVAVWAGVSLDALQALSPSWDDLQPDEYLKDGGRYRKRRHACFTIHGSDLQAVPHRPHWQPVAYNALHGGMQRWFAPVADTIAQAPAWQSLMLALAKLCSQLKGEQVWFAEAHQFRIDTTDGIGRPTPEGAHRDGVDLVAVFLVNRHAVKGGETRVFEAHGPHGQRFTLCESWSVLLLDDARVIHESTPIQPEQPGGYRDTLVVTLRGQAFQGEDPA